jgi:phosphotransacetylase
VIPVPTTEQLADIAISSAEPAQQMHARGIKQATPAEAAGAGSPG